MSKEELSQTLIFTSIIIGIITTLFQTPTVKLLIVFVAFILSSLYWIFYLFKNKLTPSKTYLCGMGVALLFTYTSLSNPLISILINVSIFIVFCIGFTITFFYEVQNIHPKHSTS